jgi:hypothetical protein
VEPELDSDRIDQRWEVFGEVIGTPLEFGYGAAEFGDIQVSDLTYLNIGRGCPRPSVDVGFHLVPSGGLVGCGHQTLLRGKGVR